MKLVQKFLCAILFVSASVSTYGGDMETPGYAAPAPCQSTSQTAATGQGLRFLRVPNLVKTL